MGLGTTTEHKQKPAHQNYAGQWRKVNLHIEKLEVCLVLRVNTLFLTFDKLVLVALGFQPKALQTQILATVFNVQ